MTISTSNCCSSARTESVPASGHWAGRLLLCAGFTCVLHFFGLSEAHATCQEGCDTSNNTFLGDDALISVMLGAAQYNTALGSHALLNNNYGTYNTAVGAYALYNNSGLLGGNFNTATGAYALYNNLGETKGSFSIDNTANGAYSLYSNTTGYDNTASGYFAMNSNTSGYSNTADGAYALLHNTANNNTATGYAALASNNTGFQNMADGVSALGSNTTGNRNVAVGASALQLNRTGSSNTGIGFQSLYNNSGSNNVGLGFNAGTNLTTGSGNVCIGYNVLGVAGESNTTRISNIFSSVASGRQVYVDSDNKIGTLSSSRRFKEQIKPMDKASEAILSLEPVSFRYKKEIEPHGGIMFGLIAEDVEKADPDLVTRDDEGKAETVRYEAVDAMLLNEFLKEHKKVEEQAKEISQLRSTLEAVTARLDAKGL